MERLPLRRTDAARAAGEAADSKPGDAAPDGALVVRNGAELWYFGPREMLEGSDAALMAGHVAYSVEMLAGTARTMHFDGRFDERDFPKGSIRWIRGNAVLEAFVSYVRAVDEFLYKDQTVNLRQARQQRPSSCRYAELRISRADCLAVDFVADPQAWLDRRPKRIEVLDVARARYSKTIAHLSWLRTMESRVPGNQNQAKEQYWPHLEIMEALDPPLRWFAESVRPEFSGLGESCLAHLEHTWPSEADREEIHGKG